MTGALLSALAFFLVPFLISLTLTALLLRWAPRLGLVDVPNERKVHTRPIPKGGGLAIFLGMVLAAAVFSLCNWHFAIGTLQFPARATASLLLLGSAIVLLGLIDDLRPLPWPLRLAVQAAAAAVVAIAWPCAAGWPERLAAWFWIVGLTNAFNMLDNMDALSGGIAAIAAAVFALAVVVRHGASSVAEAAPFVMLAGAVAGFLWFNRPPARVFMGDAGSTFLGFFLGVHSLDGGVVEPADWRTWLVPVGVLAVPWYDLAVVVAIRLSQGRSPFHADKQHLSHRLVARGWNSVAAVRIIHLLALASGLVSLAFFELAPTGALALALVLAGGWLAGAVYEFFSWRRASRGAIL